MKIIVHASKAIQDEQDIRDTAEETRMNSKVTLLNGPVHMDVAMLAEEKNHLLQLCADKRYSLEDLLGVMEDLNGWREWQSQGNPCC